MSKFARDSFGIFASQIAVMALGIGTSVITARALGPSGRGLLQLLTIFPATMSNFAKLGIPVANVYCIRRRGARTSAVASNSLLLGLGLGTALALVCWLGRGWLLHTVLRGVPAVTLPLVSASSRPSSASRSTISSRSPPRSSGSSAWRWRFSGCGPA